MRGCLQTIIAFISILIVVPTLILGVTLATILDPGYYKQIFAQSNIYKTSMVLINDAFQQGLDVELQPYMNTLPKAWQPVAKDITDYIGEGVEQVASEELLRKTVETNVDYFFAYYTAKSPNLLIYFPRARIKEVYELIMAKILTRAETLLSGEIPICDSDNVDITQENCLPPSWNQLDTQGQVALDEFLNQVETNTGTQLSKLLVGPDTMTVDEFNETFSTTLSIDRPANIEAVMQLASMSVFAGLSISALILTSFYFLGQSQPRFTRELQTSFLTFSIGIFVLFVAIVTWQSAMVFESMLKNELNRQNTGSLYQMDLTGLEGTQITTDSPVMLDSQTKAVLDSTAAITQAAFTGIATRIMIVGAIVTGASLCVLVYSYRERKKYSAVAVDTELVVDPPPKVTKKD